MPVEIIIDHWNPEKKSAGPKYFVTDQNHANFTRQVQLVRFREEMEWSLRKKTGLMKIQHPTGHWMNKGFNDDSEKG